MRSATKLTTMVASLTTLLLVVPTAAMGNAPVASSQDGGGFVAQPITPACDGAPAGRFTDVGGTHAAAIDCIGWWGVTQGTGSGSYVPGGVVTRDQMATFIARTIDLSGSELPQASDVSFPDTVGNVHAEAIERLAAAGVVGGLADGTYAPSRAVTRAQMGAFLARAYEFRSGEALPIGTESFPDIVGNVHEDNIRRIATAGLTGGTADGSYDPSATVTRAQMATFIARSLALLIDQDVASYPPANPVPLPEAPTPVPGGVIDVTSSNEPTLLGTFAVEVPPGETRRYTVPLVSPDAPLGLWFSDWWPGESTGCPIGWFDGMSVSLAFGNAGTIVPDGEGYDFGTGCLFVNEIPPSVWGGSPIYDELYVELRNDAYAGTLTEQMHVVQHGSFPFVEHPAGTAATYRFDPSIIEIDAQLQGEESYADYWDTRLQIVEPSTIEILEQQMFFPEVGSQYCDGSEIDLELYTADGPTTRLSAVGTAAGDRCSYRFEVDEPGYLRSWLWHGLQREVTVTPR